AKGEFGAIANRESEECARQKRSKFNENKIQSGHLAENSKTERDLPCTAEAQIAPGPRSKNGHQRKDNSLGQRFSPDHRQTEQKPNAKSCDQCRQSASRKIVDQL